MRRYIQLFIDTPMQVADLADHLARMTGMPFVEDPLEEGWATGDDSFNAVLTANGYPDEGFPVLSKYPFVLSTKVAEEERPHDAAAMVMMRLISEQLQVDAGARVLLVVDLQFRTQSVAPAPVPDPDADLGSGPPDPT
jgi:hypothetical protein